MRKTKIICTMGPSTDDREVLKKLMTEGMNVARLNFSHGTHEEQQRRIDLLKELREELNLPVAILLDTKGPEIRIGTFQNHTVQLTAGQQFTLTTEDIVGDETTVSVNYKGLPSVLKPGDRILIDDGLVELQVQGCDDKQVYCNVKNNGSLSNKKSLNLPGIHLDMPYMTERDKEDLLFGIKNDIDFVAASFVRTVDDVRDVKQFLAQNGGGKIGVISKIENSEGVLNIDGILLESYGIMVARGDMGVEIDFECLPKIQKDLIKKCYIQGKAAITATQMLESMVHNPRPTRAEVSDVANAIYDGTSAIMLSGETAAGAYPIESVKTMSKIAKTTEAEINYIKRFEQTNVKKHTVTDAVSHAACTMAIDLNATAIITVTKSGHTAKMISKFRPFCPIVATTTERKCYYQLGLSWGVMPLMNEEETSADGLFASAVGKTKDTGLFQEGDTVVVTGGSKVGMSGTTNVLRIHTL